VSVARLLVAGGSADGFTFIFSSKALLQLW